MAMSFLPKGEQYQIKTKSNEATGELRDGAMDTP